MEVMKGDTVGTPVIWNTYRDIVAKYDERGASAVGNIERFAFYEEAKTAYCIIATGEKAVYANVMLQKGVVSTDTRSRKRTLRLRYGFHFTRSFDASALFFLKMKQNKKPPDLPCSHTDQAIFFAEVFFT